MTDYIQIKDINKIIENYTLNDIDNINLNELKKSLEEKSKNWCVATPLNGHITENYDYRSGKLANPQHLFINYLYKEPNENIIIIITEPNKEKKISPRTPLSIYVVNQLYESLFSVHGLKGKFKTVEYKDFDNIIYYSTTVSNIKFNNYNDIFIPAEIWMANKTFTEYKYNKFKNSIIETEYEKKIKNIFKC